MTQNQYDRLLNKTFFYLCLKKCFLLLGLIICGPPCTGKSSSLNVLVDSLSELAKDQGPTIGINQNTNVFKAQKSTNNMHKVRRYKYDFK